VPRAGLNPATVVAAGAALADEVGFARVTMGLLAERVGVRPPSLYKHISSQDELHRRIAALAAAEAAEAVGTAIEGRAGRDALIAAAHAFRDYVQEHPGRYSATIGVEPRTPDDPMAVAVNDFMGSLTAVLRAYPVDEDDTVHALRALRSTFHGFAMLQAAGGFRWSTDLDDSFDWLVDLLDRGLQQPRQHRQS